VSPCIHCCEARAILVAASYGLCLLLRKISNIFDGCLRIVVVLWGRGWCTSCGKSTTMLFFPIALLLLFYCVFADIFAVWLVLVTHTVIRTFVNVSPKFGKWSNHVTLNLWTSYKHNCSMRLLQISWQMISWHHVACGVYDNNSRHCFYLKFPPFRVYFLLLLWQYQLCDRKGIRPWKPAAQMPVGLLFGLTWSNSPKNRSIKQKLVLLLLFV